MADFEIACKHTLFYEGGYADLKDDPGGRTRYGTTEKVARRHNFQGDMRDLPLEFAKMIYHKDYWKPLKLYDIKEQFIANEIFDTGVNCGIGTAGKIFQRSLNLFTFNKKLKVDGIIGERTLYIYNQIPKGHLKMFLKVLNGEQYLYYKLITLVKPRLKKFFRSWLRRV